MPTVLDAASPNLDPSTFPPDVVGVIRYLCPVGLVKRLTLEECQRFWSAGLQVGLVWEAGATYATWDGAEAARQRAALGIPDTVPIYFAEDEAQDDHATIAAALDATGVQARGIYAGAQLVQAMLDGGHATHGWIAGALSWSHEHQVDAAVADAPAAALVQLVGENVPNTDTNRVIAPDWGGWHPTTGGTTEVPMTLITRDSEPASIWISFGDNFRTHVPTMELVGLYQYLGAKGPTPIRGDWFDNMVDTAAITGGAAATTVPPHMVGTVDLHPA